MARVSQVLKDMADSEEGLAVMKKFHKTTRFDDFPRGIEATFDPIHRLLDQLAAAGAT